MQIKVLISKLDIAQFVKDIGTNDVVPVIFDSEMVPVSVCLSEDEKGEIASVFGQPQFDVYNRFPSNMTQAQFDDLMD
jgi:hypothetical protein